MDFELPPDLVDYLAEFDDFIEREIKPLEQAGRQHPLLRPPARGRPHRLGPRRPAERGVGGSCSPRCAARADAAGHYRYSFPKEYGGMDGTNLGMAVIREHLAARASACTTTCRTSTPIVGNILGVLLMLALRQRASRRRTGCRADRGTAAASRSASPSRSTAPTPRTWRRTPTATATSGCINGEKTWNTGCTSAPRPHLRPHQRPARRRHGHHRVPRADDSARASRSSSSCGRSTCPPTTPHQADRRPRAARRHLRRRGPGPRGRAELRQREPHPPGGVVARRRAVLHRRGGGVRQASASRSASRWPPTRRSSSRSSSCRRSARCCAR